MEKDKIIEFELLIEDLDFDGVDKISLVDFPAIEENFIYMGSSYKFQDINEDERIIMGPAMIPNKKIVRYDMFGNEFYIKFKEETIREIAFKFNNELRLKNTNIQHSLTTNNIVIFENWIIENGSVDKSTNFWF